VKKTVAAAAALVLAGFAPGAHADTTQDRALALCEAFERPLVKPDVVALGGTADRAFLAIYQDPTLPVAVRSRALVGLGLSASELAIHSLTADLATHAAAQRGADVLFLERDLEGLADASGTIGAATVAPFLDHAVPDVRAAAASALRIAGDRSRAPLLRAHAAQETVGFVAVAERKAADALERGSAQ